ncbi:hypothetical protein JTB14_017312 [Gonioctena quinquepunctata]|nr:hypothetical protein JTB14_017312 [Gonioctena quinquepunctata]
MAAAPKSITKLKRIVPLFNRILIKIADPASQTKGGIVLPDNVKAKVQRGTVIAVGPGSRNEHGQQIPMSVRPGDEVILADYGGTKVQLEEKEVYYIYRENEILAKIYE